MKSVFITFTSLLILTTNISCNKSIPNENKIPKTNTQNNFFRETNYVITSEDILDYPILENIIDNGSLPVDYSVSAAAKPKFRFRWGNDCPKPLGVCISVPIGVEDAEGTFNAIAYSLNPPTPTETGDGYANVFLINDDLLAIFPDQCIYQDDFTVPITSNIDLNAETCAELGKTSIEIIAGRYTMKSDYTYGFGYFGYVIVSVNSL